MKKIIACFSLFFLLAANAQEEKVHLISLENKKNAAVESNFYIENVYDGRQVKENIGTVYVSMFNSKLSAKFEKPFTEELSGLLGVLYPKNESKKPISIRINELYVKEAAADTDSNFIKKQIGTATVVLDIIEKGTDNKEYITGTFFATAEETGSDVTRKQDELITGAIKNCFTNYKNSKDTYKNAIPFNQEELANTENTNPEIKAGVYLNYKDVVNGHFLSLDDYTITKYKDGHCLLNNVTGRVESGFYGFSDGVNFYLNLFRFSAVKYYLKTETMGPNYFINEITEANMDFNGYYLAYGGLMAMGGGLVPALIFAGNGSAEHKRTPLVIDRTTGAPTILTDKYVLSMLSSNEALLKEYKKTDRTPADKKMIYKKLYNF